MLDELREEAIVNKVGGRFKLSTLIQKRLVALNGGSKPLVDLKMIDRVVTMGGRGKDRPEQDAGGPEIHRVIQPPNKMAEAMGDASARLALSPDEAERIDLPPDRPLDPVS